MSFSFEATSEDPKLLPIDLVVGLSRPQTMRKILNEATSLGVRSIRFIDTERGEPSYARAKLWSTGEWRRHVVAGAAQAFSTRLPMVTWGQSLEEALHAAGVPEAGKGRLCLDNYESSLRLGAWLEARGGWDSEEGSSGADDRPWLAEVALAIGSERGWTESERQLFRGRDWTLVGMGDRPLRTGTAVVAAVSAVKEMGLRGR